jgi:hypothetical protein
MPMPSAFFGLNPEVSRALETPPMLMPSALFAKCLIAHCILISVAYEKVCGSRPGLLHLVSHSQAL